MRQSAARWFSERLNDWGRENVRDFPWRRAGLSNYEIMVTEVLLRRTRADQVSRIWHAFFTRYPDWRSLSRTRRRVLKRAIWTLGLVEQRASALVRLAREIEFNNGHIPEETKTLQGLPGIGEYIAAAYRCVALGKRESMLDVTMARVITRFFGITRTTSADVRQNLDQLAIQILKGSDKPSLTNWYLLDHGSIVCRKTKPRCESCIFNLRCCSYMAPATRLRTKNL